MTVYSTGTDSWEGKKAGFPLTVTGQGGVLSHVKPGESQAAGFYGAAQRF